VQNTAPVGSAMIDIRPACSTSKGGTRTWPPSCIASAVALSALDTWM
jgi:hypothetical protein